MIYEMTKHWWRLRNGKVITFDDIPEGMNLIEWPDNSFFLATDEQADVIIRDYDVIIRDY